MLGHSIEEAIQAFTRSWKDWLLPSLVVVLLGCLGSCLLCFNFVLFGPLACAFCGLAQRCLAGEPISLERMSVGPGGFGRAIGAGAIFCLTIALPLYLVYFVMFLATFGPFQWLAIEHDQRDFLLLVLIALYPGFMLVVFGWFAWLYFWTTRWMFVFPVLAERDIPVLEAFRLSWERTKHDFWQLLLLEVVAGTIAYAGYMACFIGIVVTLPLAPLIVTAAYRRCFPRAAEPQVT